MPGKCEIDVTAIRDDARKQMFDGAVTSGNTADTERIIEVLDQVIATRWSA